MKYALKSVPGLADVGVPMGMGMAPELHPDVWRSQEKVSNYFLCLFSLSAPFSGYNNFGYSEPIFDRLADSDSLGHSPSYCFYAFFTSGTILGLKLKGFQGKSILESKKTAISRKSGYKPNLATKFL